MKNAKNKAWLLFTILLGTCVTVITLSDIILHPASTMISGGDSGKNYYTYLYHIIYDHGVWFPAMNYPYGEHIVFLDGQPALSIPLAYLRQWLPINTDVALAVMHLLFGLSYVLGILFVYKTLLHFKVKNWIASLFSILIIIFSPQLFRISGGHFGLAYTCFIPMIFYWLIQYNASGRKKYPFYVFITGIIAAFLHLYFLGMIFFFMCGYMLAYWIFTKTTSIVKLKHILPLVIAIVALICVVQGFLKLTDPVKDRTQYPWGILDYATTGEQILTSNNSPIWQFLHDKTSIGISDGGEGYIYLGLTTITAIIISFIAGIIYARRKRKDLLITNNTQFSGIWLFTAFAMLLLGMGVPFVWGMEWLLNYASAFRQFRSLGRFSWVFYYIMTIYAVIVINHWHITRLAKGKKTTAHLITILCLLVWSFEATGYIDTSRKTANNGRYWYKVYFSKEDKSWNTFLDEHNIKSGDYQAMILLPFFNLGTDKVFAGNEKSGWVAMLGGKVSLQLHMPMVEILGARCSWSQTFKQVHTIGGPFTEKPLFAETSSRPFLVLCFDEDSLDDNSTYLLRSATYIGHFSQLHAYTLYPDSIKENDRRNRAYAQQLINSTSIGDTCIGCETPYFIEHYNNGNAAQKLFGKGAASYTKQEDSVINTYFLTPACGNKIYEFSAWTLLNEHDNRSPVFVYEFADSTGNVFNKTMYRAARFNDNTGMWFRSSYYFSIPQNCRKIILHMQNEPVTSYIALDEVMLKPADVVIISKLADGSTLVNNHIFHK